MAVDGVISRHVFANPAQLALSRHVEFEVATQTPASLDHLRIPENQEISSLPDGIKTCLPMTTARDIAEEVMPPSIDVQVGTS